MATELFEQQIDNPRFEGGADWKIVVDLSPPQVRVTDPNAVIRGRLPVDEVLEHGSVNLLHSEERLELAPEIVSEIGKISVNPFLTEAN